MNDYSHTIISSAPRSGSTPLAKLLGQQKDVFITNELGIYDDWDNPNKWRNFIHTKEWINFVANEEIFEAHGLDLYNFRDVVMQFKFSGKDIFNWIMVNSGASVVGDKCPITYINNMPMFAKKFPNAKFIIVVRDGRDVVASQIRGYHKWPPGNPDHADHWMFPTVQQAQHLWLQVNKNTIRSLAQVDHKRYLTFRYEDAATDPDDFCEKISKFLGVDIHNINDYFKPTNMGRWQKDHPNMMDELSNEFKVMLRRFNYEKV